MPITKDMIPVLPRYARSPKAQVFSAVFPDLEIDVEIGRCRRYPGLLGAAPDTRALYDAAAQVLAGADGVLDYGCGSGIGAAELRCHFSRVTAVDADPAAVEFARAYLRSVEVEQDDGRGEIPPERRHDAIVVIDVLGQAASPEEALWAARRWLHPEGRVFIAEPRAFPAQSLLPPVVRAFSRPGLSSLLSRAGLRIERWLDGAGSFLACVARPEPAEHYRQFAEGAAALAAGDIGRAISAFAAMSEDAPSALRSEALLERAQLLAESGDVAAACRAVLEAAALSPDSARSLAGLSEISRATGDVPRSLEFAIGALERDPCDPAAIATLARAAEHLQGEDAFASWRIANGLAPADVAVASEVSRRASERGEHAYAIWVLERLREFHGELGVDYHVTLAWLYVAANRQGEARLEAEHARLLAPEAPGVPELWAHLGS